MSIEKRRRRRSPATFPLVLCFVFAVLLACPPLAQAHNPEPKLDREIVRLQGYRSPRPEGITVVAEMDLDVFGTEHHFYVIDWRQFGFTADARGGQPIPPRVLLQGDRATLALVGDAHPGQRVTILAEHRPGSADVFVLAVDLCPP